MFSSYESLFVEHTMIFWQVMPQKLRNCLIAIAYYLQLAFQIIRNSTSSAGQVAKKSQIAQFRNLQRNHTPAQFILTQQI